VCVDAGMMVMDEVRGYITSRMNLGYLTNLPVRGSCRKHNFHLNWSNEVKNNGIYGWMHGKECRR